MSDFNDVTSDAPSITSGIIWIVGRYEDYPPDSHKLSYKIRAFIARLVDARMPGYRGRWHIQCVASHKSIALSACRDESYFIGPLPLNVIMPERRVEWVGMEQPLKKIN